MNNLLSYRIITTLLIMLTISSCATTSTIDSDDEETGNNLNVKFNVLLQGNFSNISLPNQLVIKSTKDWKRLLMIHGNVHGLKKSKIDFYDNIVIAVFAGQQPSGGYRVYVSNIKRIDGNLYVTVNFKEPTNNESVSLALTQPFIILSTEKVDGKIIFLAPPEPKKSNKNY